MTDTAPVSAAAAVISAGASVATTASAIQNNNVDVRCQIQLENWTRFALTKPHLCIHGGDIQVPPTEVLPTKQESMLAIKSFGLKGSYGTVSWLVEDLNRRVVVLWSVSGNVFYDNQLGLGITTAGNTDHGRNWFDRIYQKKTISQLQYKIQQYNTNITTLESEDEKLKVEGNMGSTKKTEIKIIIRPKKNEDLADAIRTRDKSESR